MKTVTALDFFNQVSTGEITMSMRNSKSDSDHIPCVLITETDDERNEDNNSGT